MALSFTSVGSAEGTATGVNMTTSSITPVSGDLYCLWVYANSGTPAPTASGTNGFNGTWTRVAEQALSGDASQRTMFFYSVATSNTAGTVTVADGTNSGWFFGWSMVRISGATGTIVQSASNTGTAGTTASATLSSFANANNGMLFGAFTNADKTATFAAGGSDSLIDVQTVFFSVRSIGLTGNTGNNTSPSATWTGTTDWTAAALEVEATGTSGRFAYLGLLGVG